MARYVTLLDDRRFGPAGTIIDVADGDFAAWLNRDRPGLLAAAPEEAERAMSAPPQDRKVKAPRRKRGSGG